MIEDWQDRIAESAVARILHLIANIPNRRTKPIAGDLRGDFDFWFDGGAARLVTNWTEYHFADGTRATTEVAPRLTVAIRFHDGRCIEVVQIPEGEAKSFAADHHLSG